MLTKDVPRRTLTAALWRGLAAKQIPPVAYEGGRLTTVEAGDPRQTACSRSGAGDDGGAVAAPRLTTAITCCESSIGSYHRAVSPPGPDSQEVNGGSERSAEDSDVITGGKRDMIKKLLSLVPAVSLAVAMVASHPVAAAANAATVVGTINGGGTAFMTGGVAAGMKGISSFGIHATLYSDGTASGHLDCVDQMGDSLPGNIFGAVTNWSRNADGTINLQATGKFVAIPGGHPGPVTFTLTITRPGGPGVGGWTLSVGATTFCIELLVSGQIVERLN